MPAAAPDDRFMKLSNIGLEHLARAGLAARGAVYLMVGGLAVLAAVGSGGGVGGGGSALRSLLGHPLGALPLAAIGLGLVAFSAWRLTNAAFDGDRHGTSAKGLGTRAIHVLSGTVNAGLAITAFSLAFGIGSGGGGDDAAQDWTAWLLTQPFGRWLVAIVGVGIVGSGLFHFWKAWRGDMLKRLSVPAERRHLALTLGRVGYAARGVTFSIIGGFLLIAALHSDSSEAKGLGGALEALREQPVGWVLLGLVAAGLAAFGAFGFAQARWRRIEGPDLSDARQMIDALARRAGA
jgi:hypothetical protein